VGDGFEVDVAPDLEEWLSYSKHILDKGLEGDDGDRS
jgi:hypothetical protein